MSNVPMRQTGARTYFIRSAYFIQEDCIMKTLYKNIALFVGGSLFGSAGIRLLGSNDAKNAYTLSLIHISEPTRP